MGLLLSSQSFEVGLEPDRRSVELSVAGRILWLVLGPAPARMDCVGSLAEWRQTEARANRLGAAGTGGYTGDPSLPPKAGARARSVEIAP